MGKSEDIRSKTFTAGDSILFDANIWLFLQGPQGNPKDPRRGIYTQALADMLTAKCKIAIDALVVSEFINRFSRIEFELVKTAPNDRFKVFRDSPAFKPIAAAIAKEVKEIFALCNRIESGFSVLNDVELLNKYAGGDSDFNDLMIADICKTNGYMLVTHDADFKGADLHILTANNKLLAP